METHKVCESLAHSDKTIGLDGKQSIFSSCFTVALNNHGSTLPLGFLSIMLAVKGTRTYRVEVSRKSGNSNCECQLRIESIFHPFIP